MSKTGLVVKLLILCLVIVCVSGPAIAAQEDPEKLWELGEKAYNEGRHREALTY
jgi:hypothetical protein